MDAAAAEAGDEAEGPPGGRGRVAGRREHRGAEPGAGRDPEAHGGVKPDNEDRKPPVQDGKDGRGTDGKVDIRGGKWYNKHRE